MCDEEDYRIAAGCGIGREEAARIFEQTAARHQKIAEEVEAMYREREHARFDDEGEAVSQTIKRYMTADW